MINEMKTFLALVAQDLYRKLGNELSHTAIIFPNKRASLFFNEQLAAQSERPIWSPRYISISELFEQLAPLKKGDPIRLVCELHKVFCEETGSQETLDDFFFWGELLISDFDDLDKNLVPANQLFTNLKDLKGILEGNNFLTEEQVEAVRQFFHNFSPDRRTELKERFASLWDKLGSIYHRYRNRLQELGIAYEGMLYRNVIENLDVEALPYRHYVFVGFNVLNQVETLLFKKLQTAVKAKFYWDYDRSYTDASTTETPQVKHEAGEFILRNLQLFPNELPKEYFDQLRHPKRIEYISAATENAQARYLSQWLKGVSEERREMQAESGKEESKSLGKETAIVLCNEAILLPVLHSLPEEMEHVNITMGFPLSQTPVYSLVNAWVELQTKGYRSQSGRYHYDSVLALLKHPYVRRLSCHAATLEQELIRNNRFYPYPSELKQDEVLELFFTPVSGNLALSQRLTELIQLAASLYRRPVLVEDEEETPAEKTEPQEDIFDQLYKEALFKSYTLVNRLASLIESGELAHIKSDTFRRLLNKLLTAATIPFHGEPAIGLQIMGLLETRNLDFRNLVMLSVNEGKLPKAEGDSSFIPYNLRRAFGMTTIEHKNAVYAYYFYRLIQRAEHVTLLYNTSSEGLNRGEMSRFMLQFLVESPYPIKQYYLQTEQSPQHASAICIEKTPQLMQELKGCYDTRLRPDAYLSPSALNTYLDCPLMFYYRYVQHIKTPDEVSDEIDNALFGTIFHRAAELAYTDLCKHGQEVRREDIEALLKNKVKIQEYVDCAFKEEFFHVSPDEKPEYNGTQLINSKVIASYLRQLLRVDLQHAPFTLVGMEKKVRESIIIASEGEPLPLCIGGTIDRMDCKEDTLRIVDYKTGGTPKTPENIEQLFTPAHGRPNNVFQTFLYAAMQCKAQSLKVSPALLYIHQASSEHYSPTIEIGPARQPKIPVTNFAFYEDEFRQRLHQLLQDIFNPALPFTQTEDEKRCEYCDFRKYCRR